MSKRLIGFGYTNANGVATLDYDAEGNELQNSGYVGQGVGNVDISASAVIDGSTFVSEPCNVYDCLYVDEATTGKKNSSYITNGSISVGTPTDNGTELTYSSQYAEYRICEIGSTTQYQIPIPFCVEFDLVSMTGNVLMIFYQSSPYLIKYMTYGSSSSISEEIPVKFEVKDNKLYRTINGTTTSETFNYTDDKLKIAFQSRNATGTCKFKNLKIYPI